MFRQKEINELLGKISEEINSSDLNLVELSYLTAAIMRGIGEAAYDKEEVSYDYVLKDYRKSPSYAAALILHADQIHKIHELFVQEAQNPSINMKAWEKFGEELNE